MKTARRRLVQQGESTLMVSLPAPWIKLNNLEKGSEVSIDPLNSDLLISAKKQDYKSETSIKILGHTESAIRTIVTNTYRVGYDRIRVEYGDKKQLEVVETVVKNMLIGFEIVSRGQGYCIIENITEPSEEQFDNILSKIFYNIEELFTITKERLEQKIPEESYEAIQERLQKYDNYCKRIISKQKFSNNKSEFLWAFLAILLHAHRELHHLNKFLPKDYKTSVEVKDLFNINHEIFELIKKAYFEKNTSYLVKVHELEKSTIYDKGYKLLQIKKGPDAVVIYHLLISMREFYQSNSPLHGIIL